MPTRGLINPELLTDIADAIREKNGSNARMTPAQMAAAISNLELSEAIKQALLNCFAHVAWIDDQGQTYYDALEDALYPTAPPAELLSISAVFEQGQTVIYDTDSLDDLKPMLTVTAHYTDGTSAEVTTYTLSGTLTVGTSTITVSYGGKTTTFDVTVTNFLTLLTFFKGANFAVSDGRIHTSSYNIKRACCFLPVQINGGVQYELDGSISGWVDPAYPIPIPNGCTKITVSCVGLLCAINVHKDIDGVATSIDSGHWSSVGGETNYDLSTFITSGATHVSIGFKNSSDTSLENTTVDDTTVQIAFS